MTRGVRGPHRANGMVGTPKEKLDRKPQENNFLCGKGTSEFGHQKFLPYSRKPTEKKTQKQFGVIQVEKEKGHPQPAYAVS